MDSPEWLKPIDAARRLKIPTRELYRLIDGGELPAYKFGRVIRLRRADVDAYIERNGILTNPLLYDGYPSIGCAPCTARPLPGADPRSGRWAGRAKTECGLHG